MADQDLTFNLSNLGTQSIEFWGGLAAVADRIDTVGGQSFDYNDPYLSSLASYVSFGSGNTNVSGSNDVGLADLSALGSGVAGMGPTVVAIPSCKIIEGDVLLDNSSNSWHFSIPEDYGDLYFDADYKVTDAAGVRGNYGRHVLLHELGHTLGLAHNDHGFSAMNYDVRPWSNRIDEKMMEFLPDDREALRYLYPGAATEKDVAVLMTWFDSTDISSSGAATQKKLCAPSKGIGYSPSKFDPTCGVRASGVDGSTRVCPGDKIYTRYAAANYSTMDMTMDEELWFSKNDWLNRTAGVDKKSATSYASLTVLANQSQRKGKSFIVPSGLDWDTDYYPILFLDTGSDLANEESEQNNWIPLRATIHVKRQVACP